MFTSYIVNWLPDGGKSVFLCRVVSCRACSFTVLCQKKSFTKKKTKEKKEKKRVRRGRTDISGPGPFSFLSRSCAYYIPLTIHSFYFSYYVVYKRPEKAATWHKINLSFLPICQEEINKVIFAWVYELVNNRRNFGVVFYKDRSGSWFDSLSKGFYNFRCIHWADDNMTTKVKEVIETHNLIVVNAKQT